jgi:hypothetical protein
MIIKSLSRKARTTSGSIHSRSGGSPFHTLLQYMNRGVLQEDGRAVLWHNLYGGQNSREEEILFEFEKNAKYLPERKNGNVLYHEIISFAAGHSLSKDELCRKIADIGQKYLQERAPNQLAYGVIHQDTQHVHLHLIVSANEIGKRDRVRLSKEEFLKIQKGIELFTLEKYKELSQTPIYSKDRQHDRIKQKNNEQEMKQRTGVPSKKELLKGKLHQIFERARNPNELAALLSENGVQFYTRGRNTGVILREADGTEKRHRLDTLGVGEHYAQMNERFLKNPELQAHRKEKGMTPPNFPPKGVPNGFERDPSPVEIVAEEFLTGELHPHWHPNARVHGQAKNLQESSPAISEKHYDDPVLKAIRERELALLKTIEKRKDKDRER